MYNLLLANGTNFQILKHSLVSVKTNGTFVKGLKLDIINSDIDTIKKFFNNNDNTSIINVYSDDNTILVNEYIGYSKVVQIAINTESNDESDTTIYTVTLSFSDDVKDTLRAFEKSLNKTRETQNTLVMNVNTLATKTNTLIKDVANKADIPESNIDKMTLSEAKKYMINVSKKMLSDFLESNTIISTCHNDTAARYSITSEKQQHLAAMVMITSMAEQNGFPYQPSWNAAGEECTYDWTLAELQQLALEIQAVVRPLVSKQQEYEALIKEANTIEDVKAVQIVYEI